MLPVCPVLRNNILFLGADGVVLLKLRNSDLCICEWKKNNLNHVFVLDNYEWQLHFPFFLEDGKVTKCTNCKYNVVRSLHTSYVGY